MELRDIRRLVEERQTGQLDWKKKSEDYQDYIHNIEQHKQFKAFLRSEIVKRVRPFNTGKLIKTTITTNHIIYEPKPGKPGYDDTYWNPNGVVQIPNRISREIFQIIVKIQTRNAPSLCIMYHTLNIDLIRHEQNMNWQTNDIGCYPPFHFDNNPIRQSLVFIARELEGIFGVKDSLVEKNYKDFQKNATEVSK